MLDPEVQLAVIPMVAKETTTEGLALIDQDRERSHQLGRELEVLLLGAGVPGAEVVRLARDGEFDLIILALPGEQPAADPKLWDELNDYVVHHAHCPVFLASRPSIPDEVAE